MVALWLVLLTEVATPLDLVARCISPGSRHVEVMYDSTSGNGYVVNGLQKDARRWNLRFDAATREARIRKPTLRVAKALWFSGFDISRSWHVALTPGTQGQVPFLSIRRIPEKPGGIWLVGFRGPGEDPYLLSGGR
jgi:hypothetical protein